MRFRQLARATVPALVSAYGQAAARHAEASADDDALQADRYAEVLGAICAELRRRDEDAYRALSGLLDDANPYVRLWAASHVLPVARDAAEAVLDELGRSDDEVLAANARWTLERWSADDLPFP